MRKSITTSQKTELSWGELGVMAAVAIFATFAVSWRLLDLPMHGEESGFYGTLVRHYHDTKFLVAGNPGWIEIYHPPLYHGFIAGLTILLGWKFEVLRSGAAVASSGLLVALYALARLHASRFTAALLTGAFLSSTLYLMQAVLIEPDLVAAAWAIVALRFVLTGRERAGSLAFLLACLSNGILIVLAPAFVGILATSAPRSVWRRRLVRFFLPTALGLGAWCAYFIVAMGGTGDLANPTNFVWLRGTGYLLNQLFIAWPMMLFLYHGREVVTFVLVFWFARRMVGKGRTVPLNPDLVGLAIAIISQLLLLGFFAEPSERYGALSMALIYVLAAWGLEALGAARIVQAGIALLCVLASLFSWNKQFTPVGYIDALSKSIDLVRCVQLAAREIEQDMPDAVIYAEFPWEMMFRMPHDGYVTRPFKVVPLYGGGATPITHNKKKKALLVFAAATDNPTEDMHVPAMLELRKRAVGPCRRWEVAQTYFFACPL